MPYTIWAALPTDDILERAPCFAVLVESVRSEKPESW